MARKKEEATKKKKRHFRRNLFFGLLILIILYTGVHLLSRTDGVRAMVVDKISDGIRLPVALESCAATPLLGLQLQGLSFSGVKMPSVHLRLNGLAWIAPDQPFVQQLDIQGLEIRLKWDPPTGRWEPLVLHPLGSQLGTVLGLAPPPTINDASLPKLPRWLINKNTILQLRHAKVVWINEQNQELASLSDANLSMETQLFTNRKVRQTLFKCERIKLASGKLLRDFQLEAFHFEHSSATTILNMTDSDGEYPPFSTPTLWQDLGQRLNALSEL
jgi:hypothetical protein